MNYGKCLYIVIPCYNEEEMLPITSAKLAEFYQHLFSTGKISRDSKILFVNDGSSDNTWNLIKRYHEDNSIFSGINLTRNRGHQNALLAGLMTAKDLCDISVSMDADLQDDIHAIEEMIDYNAEGYNIVYGVRKDRSSDSWFKRFTAETYYKLLNKLGGEIVYNHADFRLMDREALNELSKYQEVNLFLRGIVPMIGLDSTCVYYERHERQAGSSKYPLKKMISLAIEGITSLSTRPIKLVTNMGITISIISLFVLLYIVIQHFLGRTISGWASTTVSIWLLGGIQILAIGVIGEYIGKIYLETKRRPRYAIREVLDDNLDDNKKDLDRR